MAERADALRFEGPLGLDLPADAAAAAPRWWQRGDVAQAIDTLGLVALSAWVGLAWLDGYVNSNAQRLLIGFVAVMTSFWMFIPVHEAGHWLAARLAGLTVIRARFGPLELIAKRRGWRARWARLDVLVVAFVQAVPDVARPPRAQMLAFASGGPLANFAAALLLAGVAWAASGLFADLAAAAALVSTLQGLLNLWPATAPRPRDGAVLLGWLRGAPGTATELLALRVLSLSVAGVTADRLPAAVLDRLEATPLLQVLGRWLRLKAAQYRGDWAGAADIAREAQAGIDARPPAERRFHVDLHWLLGVEGACAQALATRDAGPVEALVLDRRAFALSPAPWWRAQAIASALRGDADAFERHLAQAQAAADDSPERALGLGEAKAQAALRATLAGA
jgi:hypothetical protein